MNKSKKNLLLLLTIVIVATTCFVLAACGDTSDDDPKKYVYTVTFYADDSVYDRQTVTNGETVTLPEDPEFMCVVFDGWYLDEELTNKFDESQSITQHTNLYAKLTENHTPVVDAKLDPTCGADGLTEGSHCEVCEKVLVEQQTIPATGHDYVDGVCSKCGYFDTGLTFELSSDGTSCYVKNVGTFTGSELVIPRANGDGKPCVGIGSNAFQECKTLTSVTVPDSIKSIGSCAFLRCTNLKTVTLGNGITEIPGSAFCYCESLTSIALPDGLKSIGEDAFRNCTSLTSISLPTSLTSIERAAFSGCKSLQSVDIPYNVTSIGENAFLANWELKSLTLSPNLTTISESAFWGCIRLTSVTIPDKVTELENQAFHGCRNLVSVTLGLNVKSVADSAFENCDKLIEVYNRSSLDIHTGDEGFGGVAQHAKNVYTTEGNSYLKTDENGFMTYDQINLVAYVGNEADITVPAEIRNIYPYAFRDNNIIKSVVVQGTNRVGQEVVIGDGAFQDCTNLNYVELGYGVTQIDHAAFFDCDKLRGITIPSSLTYIGNDAFGDCYQLVEVFYTGNVSLSLTAGSDSYGGIAYYAKNIGGSKEGSKVTTDENGYVIYKEYNSLYQLLVDYEGNETELTLPFGITEINTRAFVDDAAITSVILPDSIDAIGDYAFSGCTSLTSIDLKGCKTIGRSAFNLCESLASITIPDTVTLIDDYAFQSCKALADITLPDALANIGFNAFQGTAWYNNQPDGLVYIGNVAYIYKGNDVDNPQIVLKEGTIGIAGRAFSNHSAITSITIPNSVTSIAASAFNGCSGLTQIYYNGTIEQWNAIEKPRFAWCDYSITYTVNCTDGTLEESTTEYRRV